MKKVHVTTEDITKCQLVKAMLEKDYAQHQTIQLLARQVGTNENKLKVCFKQLFKKTIHSFVTCIRIEKAKELLEYSELPIDTIACKLGLDHSNLIKQFKRHTGYTPREWRHIKSNNDKVHV
ncbi:MULTISPECIES: helix-turn-helix domain-containing protein [Niastella]|uniref:Helix-turn-helix transcriptional regulator n=1 Tax=Niastella soli TaxID=2821487 RepID=A0ABS3Z3A8_9BACT|nr:AraC family transcriptional regulator [Niastella soli]MBO9204645.1 helix-turn-helix transcriptional regulator [Niastella soli]